MSITTADKTVQVLTEVVSRLGLILSDKEPEVVFRELARFLSSVGLEHVLSVGYTIPSPVVCLRTVQSLRTLPLSLEE